MSSGANRAPAFRLTLREIAVAMEFLRCGWEERVTAQGLLRAKIYCCGLGLAVGAASATLYWWLGGWSQNFKQGGIIAYGYGVLWFGILFLPIGAGLLAWRIVNLYRARASARWPVTPGLVLTSEIKVEKHLSRGSFGLKSYYFPNIRYVYTVLGKRHENNMMGFGLGTVFYDRSEAETMIGRYPTGAHVDVHYDPEDPQQSCLRPYDSDALIFTGRALWAFVAPFFFAFFVYIVTR
jgi:hypothetical protein